jgi:hypothetical protein
VYDILYLVLILLFFGLTGGLLALCQRLMEDNP